MKHMVSLVLGGLTSIAQAQPPSDSLIAYFPMDANALDVIENLTPTDSAGVPSFCPDRFGVLNGAACFDGSSFWSYGDVLDMDSSDFAVSFWFRADAVPQYPLGSRIVSKGGTLSGDPENSGWGTLINGFGGDSARIELFTGDANSVEDTTEYAFQIGVWTHALMHRCDTVLSLYLDGALVNETYTAPNRNLNTNTVFAIGALDRSPSTEPDGSYFQGAVDDIRIYKGRCLSQPEIDTLALSAEHGYRTQAPSFIIYPNPARDQLTVHMGARWSRGGMLTILDAIGRSVMEQRFTAGITATYYDAVLDVTELKTGIYILVVRTEEGIRLAKFHKQ